jgi:CarboxypepD_reg-like domain/Chlorophyllase
VNWRDELQQHFTIATGSKSNTSVKTKSFLEATAVPGHFPLIIYLSSYNGMSYENIPLFENLASHGFIVLSISSIGRYPGNMTTRFPDVLEQVKDAEFACHLITKQNKDADTSKIAVIGYSYGGIAAALLAMKNRSVQAILSLDGSELHHYGMDKGEDNDFNELRRAPDWSPLTLHCSYAYMESDHRSEDGPADSSYHLGVRTAGTKYYARFFGSAHEDFSCVSALGTGDDYVYELVNRLALNYFDQTLKDQGTPFDNGVSHLLMDKKISLSESSMIRRLGRINLKGEIVDAEANVPVPYASIGIPSGNCGTVSANDGKFSLSVDDTLATGIVRISSLGYKPRTYTVSELRAILSGQSVVKLNEMPNQLAEVRIKTAKPRTRITGNTSQSKFFNVGFPLRDLGSEVGIKISLGGKKVLLRSFNFNISNTRMDSCAFRLNIYALKNEMPGDNLLKQNIITRIGNRTGSYTIDLTRYRILLNGPIFVSLEWIDGKTAADHGAVFFSAGLLSSSYHRKTTEADWVKFKGLGAAFNLKVEEE